MKHCSTVIITLLFFQFAHGQGQYQDLDNEAKTLRKEGYKPIRDFDISLTDQLKRAASMAESKSNGTFDYTLVYGESGEFTDLRKAEMAAYIRSMEEFLATTQENKVSGKLGGSQNNVDSPYGKSLTENSVSVEGGKRLETFTSVTEFTYQMLLKANTHIDENQNVHSKFSLVQRGFPLFGVERVVNIFRKTESGKYEVICYLAIDNFWLENQSLEFTGKD